MKSSSPDGWSAQSQVNETVGNYSRREIRGVIFGLAVWWIVPVIVRCLFVQVLALPLALVVLLIIALVVLLPICAAHRKESWIVLLWIPALLWCVIGAGALWIQFAIALAIPFGGDAAVICGVLATGLSVGAIFCLFVHPRIEAASPSAVALFVLALVNMVSVYQVGRLANFAANKTDVVLHILDSRGEPVSGAVLNYKVFGYGNLGDRPSTPDIAEGPVTSGTDGVVHLNSLGLRHEIDGEISKAGFRKISFNLGMQYEKWVLPVL